MRAPSPDNRKGGSMVDGVETYAASADTEGRGVGEANLKTLGGGKWLLKNLSETIDRILSNSTFAQT